MLSDPVYKILDIVPQCGHNESLCSVRLAILDEIHPKKPCTAHSNRNHGIWYSYYHYVFSSLCHRQS